MKRFMAAAILAVPLLASSAQASGCCWPCQINTPCVKINIPSYCIPIPQVDFRIRWGCCAPPSCGPGGGTGCGISFCGDRCGYGGGLNGPVGPWYLYWPLEAHFNAPAMPQYPYWPSPMGMAPGSPIGGPAAGPANFHSPGMQQVGYVPPYWYGR
jgi:hypothetical protein